MDPEQPHTHTHTHIHTLPAEDPFCLGQLLRHGAPRSWPGMNSRLQAGISGIKLTGSASNELCDPGPVTMLWASISSSLDRERRAGGPFQLCLSWILWGHKGLSSVYTPWSSTEQNRQHSSLRPLGIGICDLHFYGLSVIGQ